MCVVHRPPTWHRPKFHHCTEPLPASNDILPNWNWNCNWTGNCLSQSWKRFTFNEKRKTRTKTDYNIMFVMDEIYTNTHTHMKNQNNKKCNNRSTRRVRRRRRSNEEQKNRHKRTIQVYIERYICICVCTNRKNLMIFAMRRVHIVAILLIASCNAHANFIYEGTQWVRFSACWGSNENKKGTSDREKKRTTNHLWMKPIQP